LDKSVLDEFLETALELRPYMKDVAMLANNCMAKGGKLLLEGAQGAMLDVSFGTYPYVTSSNLVSGSCAGGLGIPPWKIENIIGVIKAYSTRVGNGPYPAELTGDFADKLRTLGNEFGSVTGRPRSVGWLDLVALRYLSCINGVTGLAVMKADVLAGIENIGLIVGYKDKRTNEEMDGYPITKQAWENVMPIIEFVDGWDFVLDGDKINKNYAHFLKKVEDFIQVPSIYLSSGAERTAGLWV
jgi:adenylosuccinate synthase